MILLTKRKSFTFSALRIRNWQHEQVYSCFRPLLSATLLFYVRRHHKMPQIEIPLTVLVLALMACICIIQPIGASMSSNGAIKFGNQTRTGYTQPMEFHLLFNEIKD